MRGRGAGGQRPDASRFVREAPNRAGVPSRDAPRAGLQPRYSTCVDDLERYLLAGAAAGAGSGAGLLKSTVGGTLMAFSFSTEKLGLTFILNSIAVRLVGNERTVVLYSCTDLMYRLRATVIRFSVPSSWDCRSRKF